MPVLIGLMMCATEFKHSNPPHAHLISRVSLSELSNLSSGLKTHPMEAQLDQEGVA